MLLTSQVTVLTRSTDNVFQLQCTGLSMWENASHKLYIWSWQCQLGAFTAFLVIFLESRYLADLFLVAGTVNWLAAGRTLGGVRLRRTSFGGPARAASAPAT